MLIPINNAAAFLPSLCQGKGTKQALLVCCCLPLHPMALGWEKPSAALREKGKDGKRGGQRGARMVPRPWGCPTQSWMSAHPGSVSAPARHRCSTACLEPGAEMMLMATSQCGGRLERSPRHHLPELFHWPVRSQLRCAAGRGDV